MATEDAETERETIGTIIGIGTATQKKTKRTIIAEVAVEVLVHQLVKAAPTTMITTGTKSTGTERVIGTETVPVRTPPPSRVDPKKRTATIETETVTGTETIEKGTEMTE